MKRGFVLGAVFGALVALGSGLAIAFLPTTPTWTLWRLTLALDSGDFPEVTKLIDLPAVALNAMGDLGDSGGSSDETQGIPMSQLATALFSGDRIGTVFDDPDRPVEITPTEFLAAWWSMERQGARAKLTLKAGKHRVRLDLEQRQDLRWKIVSVSPLRALLRIEPARDPA